MAEEVPSTSTPPVGPMPEDRPIREERPVRVERPLVADPPVQRAAEPVFVEPPVVDASRAIDRLRWGPIVGGILITLAGLIVFDVLGLAVGFPVFNPASPTLADLGTGAGIWGAVSALVAFFIGGWLAGRTTAPGVGVRSTVSGTVNGAMVWASTLLVLVVLGHFGISNSLGYFGATVSALAAGLHGAGSSALGAATNNAWGTFVALVLTLICAAVGGWLGYTSQPARRTLA